MACAPCGASPVVVVREPPQSSLCLQYDYSPCFADPCAAPRQRAVEEYEYREPLIVLQEDGVMRRPAAEYFMVPDAESAVNLDAADGVIDGKYYGAEIYTPNPTRVVLRGSQCAAPAAVSLQPDRPPIAADRSLGGDPCADLAAENARLRGLLSDLSRTFQDRFEDLAAGRDQDYLDLQAKYQNALRHSGGSPVDPFRGIVVAAPKPRPKPKSALKAAPAVDQSVKKGAKTAAGTIFGPGAGRKGKHGVLVTVQEAAGLPCPSAGRPLVRLELHGTARETASQDPGPNPVWNQPLELQEPSRGGPRRLTVVAKTQLGEMGRATIELPAYAVKTDVWVPVSKDGVPAGSVHLAIDAPDASGRYGSAPRPPIHPGGGHSPGKHRAGRAKSPERDVEFGDGDMGIPSRRPVMWDLLKMDGEKFWVCLVAKEGHLVLDPAEYRKAPALWTMSQASTEAIFNAYNSPFQTSMRRRGLNKLNSYWQREINDMKGLYLGHLDEAGALRAKEEQILKLERELAAAEASRDDLAGKLVESNTLLLEKAAQMKHLNADMNTQLEGMSEARRQMEGRRTVEDEDFLRLAQENREWAWRTEARVFQMDHDVPLEGLAPEELMGEVNALREELQRQQGANQLLKERLRAVETNAAVRGVVVAGPGGSPSRPLSAPRRG